MDNLEQEKVQDEASQQPAQPANPYPIKSKKITLISIGIIAAALIIIAIFGLAFLLFQSGSTPKTGPVAQINNQAVPGIYFDREIEYYPGEVTEEVKKMLQQKVINDEVTLLAAQSEGLITDYHNNSNPSKDEYLKRTEQIKELKQKINNSANSIEVTIVSLWFYNNDYIGPKGLTEGKRIAYAKIKPLYDNVKSGKISIEQAGESIRTDQKLKEIDPIWEINSINTHTFLKDENKKGYTFWDEFDKMLWDTKVGELTPLYLGGGRHKDGKYADELYMFAKVNKKINDKGYSSYEQWLEAQKQNFQIKTEPLSLNNPFKNLIPDVSAQDDGGSSGGTSDNGTDTSAGSNNDSSGNEGNSQGQSGGGDNPCNSADPWGCGDGHGYAEWVVNVISETGAPVIGARVHYTNGCKQGANEEHLSGAQGIFGLGPGFGYGCGCNGHEFKVYYKPPQRPARSDNSLFSIVSKAFAQAPLIPSPPDKLCGESSKSLSNDARTVHHTVTCTPNYVPRPSAAPAGNNPLPTPNPNLSCGKSCNESADCGSYPEDGCTVCTPNAQGRKVCSPARCGVTCSKDDECAGAERDSCQACEGGKCSYFDQSSCACDGFEAEAMSYPAPFTFNAFAKVEGANVSKSMVRGIQFKMSESDAANPNAATIITQSEVINPTIVSTGAEKVRYQAKWTMTPPEIKDGKIYRVYQEIKCAPKRAQAANAKNPYNYQSVAGIETANAAELDVARNDIQLKNLNLIKRGDTDKCKFLIFEYNKDALPQR